ncbi:MAG: hypothetical protein C4523_07150 [Myxococcales bacterium]|nr:MAG: hypothetical protein C4523_07150 [Myxococcales bacterium]
MTTITLKKRNSATIALPRRKTGKAEAMAVSKPRRQKATHRNATAAAKSGLRWTAAKTSWRVEPLERALFVVVLALFLAVASLFAWTKIETRSAKFGITELKQEQLALEKEREKLLQQIAAYKRPELIMKRAGQNGMQLPESHQVIVLP